jgi:hypothetical protein
MTSGVGFDELLTFADMRLGSSVSALRTEVRDFIFDNRESGMFEPRCDSWLTGYSPEFSRRLGERGWLGMTWPKRYGGHERAEIERFVVTEELLAAGAPVAAHWGAERQVGPQFLRFGSDYLSGRFLPQFAAGSCYFAAAMSEPDTGSDLASLTTRAQRTDGGWNISGTKVWTSHAHRCHFLIVLCRTSPLESDRHAGISQLIVDMTSPGIQLTPIHLISGEHHFNQIVFDNVFVPDEMVLGEIGEGWAQVSAELALERSGPDRFMSTFPLLRQAGGEISDESWFSEYGHLVSSLWCLRWASLGIVQRLDQGTDAGVPAAVVKDVGTTFDQLVPEAVRLYWDDLSEESLRLLREGIEAAPGFTLRGGTSEMLRTIVSRNLSQRT